MNSQRFNNKNSNIKKQDLSLLNCPLVWNEEQVCSWLLSFNQEDLSSYTKSFFSNKITGKDLFFISEQNLKDDLKINSLHNRIFIMNEIREMKESLKQNYIKVYFKNNYIKLLSLNTSVNGIIKEMCKVFCLDESNCVIHDKNQIIVPGDTIINNKNYIISNSGDNIIDYPFNSLYLIDLVNDIGEKERKISRASYVLGNNSNMNYYNNDDEPFTSNNNEINMEQDNKCMNNIILSQSLNINTSKNQFNRESNINTNRNLNNNDGLCDENKNIKDKNLNVLSFNNNCTNYSNYMVNQKQRQINKLNIKNKIKENNKLINSNNSNYSNNQNSNNNNKRISQYSNDTNTIIRSNLETVSAEKNIEYMEDKINYINNSINTNLYNEDDCNVNVNSIYKNTNNQYNQYSKYNSNTKFRSTNESDINFNTINEINNNLNLLNSLKNNDCTSRQKRQAKESIRRNTFTPNIYLNSTPGNQTIGTQGTLSLNSIHLNKKNSNISSFKHNSSNLLYMTHSNNSNHNYNHKNVITVMDDNTKQINDSNKSNVFNILSNYQSKSFKESSYNELDIKNINISNCNGNFIDNNDNNKDNFSFNYNIDQISISNNKTNVKQSKYSIDNDNNDNNEEELNKYNDINKNSNTKSNINNIQYYSPNSKSSSESYYYIKKIRKSNNRKNNYIISKNTLLKNTINTQDLNKLYNSISSNISNHKSIKDKDEKTINQQLLYNYFNNKDNANMKKNNKFPLANSGFRNGSNISNSTNNMILSSFNNTNAKDTSTNPIMIVNDNYYTQNTLNSVDKKNAFNSYRNHRKIKRNKTRDNLKPYESKHKRKTVNITFNSTSDYKQFSNEVDDVKDIFYFSDESDNLYIQRGNRFIDRLNNYYNEAKKIKCKTNRKQEYDRSSLNDEAMNLDITKGKSKFM